MTTSPELPKTPVFAVLDGMDGCGKTTQATRLVEEIARLRGEGSDPLHLREPGSTVAGERIRALVLDPDVQLGSGSLALLFAAARRETLEQLVAPALAQGRDVVIERFHASTFAYQGGAGLTDDDLLSMLHGWAGSPRPTIEIVLEIDPEDSFARAMARDGGGSDRFESRGLEFQRRVAAGMHRYVERAPLAVGIDGRGSEDEVAGRVIEAVLRSAAEATLA
ncbi:Thymidylate kinase [Planctomycetes bacterium Poly30]|uniref:Thymidylate kinase n=1 Tax=Saltatorellus ferox TaxID=2528018 RepID=A0A518ERV9_9BACT|nr:Thymidylate kinase [Planctomycetes bacterium Poly30]